MSNFWTFGALVLLILLLSPYFVFALRIEFDDPKDIKDWELGPGVTAEVSNGQLELKVVGGQNSGVFFGDPKWTDYKMEVKARKVAGPYFHLFTRVQKPTQDFYFIEISYNSNTNSIFRFDGGTGIEITGGDRPKRPESTDTKGGDAYTIIFEVKGEVIKTYIDGKLQVETKDKTYKDGRPGLGGRDSTVLYDYVEINGPGITTSPVEHQGKLTTTWGMLKLAH
ncbi:hypothetical protein CMK18_12400 [Candidatus Poribacteria bacterium]|nr:hypothetical protein [Candidatus Poribacteria bacterium]